MKLVRVALGMLVRQEKSVTIEVPDDFLEWDEARRKDLLHAAYDADEGDDFVDDVNWGCEEATHHIIGEGRPGTASFIADADGNVVRVEKEKPAETEEVGFRDFGRPFP